MRFGDGVIELDRPSDGGFRLRHHFLRWREAEEALGVESVREAVVGEDILRVETNRFLEEVLRSIEALAGHLVKLVAAPEIEVVRFEVFGKAPDNGNGRRQR